MTNPSSHRQANSRYSANRQTTFLDHVESEVDQQVSAPIAPS
jgi:hypothetical protein